MLQKGHRSALSGLLQPPFSGGEGDGVGGRSLIYPLSMAS